jgi:hypothetical protein
MKDRYPDGIPLKPRLSEVPPKIFPTAYRLFTGGYRQSRLEDVH